MASSKANSSKGSKGATSARQKKSSTAKKQPQKRSLKQQAPEERESILSNRLRNDLIGILLIAIAIVLMIAVCITEDAIITHWIAAGMHNGFGIGAFILPIFIALFGVCFFFRKNHELVMPRLALGMALVFIAIISLMGVNTPGAADNTGALLQPALVIICGGYVGNAIAFCLLQLVGKAIAIVILIAVMLGGIVLIGLSISGFFEWLFGRKDRREEQGYVPPYSRARGQRSNDDEWFTSEATGGGEGFIPAGSTVLVDGSRPAKTKRFKKGGPGETQVLNGGGSPGKTMVLDPDDELMQGRPKDTGRIPGKTRSLSGAADAFSGKDAAEAVPAEEIRKPELLTDSKRSPVAEGAFVLPDPKLLKRSGSKARGKSSESELAMLGARLQDTLQEFSVDARVVGWVHGPTVTLFKVSLASGVRVNRITALADDIALAFASPSVRIFSPIAGTSLVGIEIPNDTRDGVLLGDVLPPAGDRPLLMAIGKDVEGNPITADLAKMPHLLIGGTTGSGKSVAINSMIMSVLMRATPDEVRMILIDPKRVELSLYNDIPHLYVPVVTDPHKAASTLAWAVTEMERRLRMFEEVGVRDVKQYMNLREQRLAELAEAAACNPDGAEGSEEEEWEPLPRIMIVIDELADLMMVAGKEVETSISRIAQLARAAGIHMIIATQRPSTNVITGLIKANIVNRIAFNVASGIDSRVILDSVGAEHLIGLGDMLFSKPEYGKPQRIQGCFVGEDEIKDVCKLLKKQGKPDYHEDIFTAAIPVLDANGGSFNGGAGGDDDALLWEAAEIVVDSQLGSTSALQRRLKVGYARAGRIMDMLEDKGIVGPANGSKPRDVYISDTMELENIKAIAQNDML